MANKTLFISDFDDTLVKTSAMIGVTNANGETRQMNPAEYAVYVTEPGDQFDYSQFDDLVDPRPIPRYVRLLKKAVANDRVHKVAILTARGNEQPVIQFLKSVGLTTGVKIVALGNSDPAKKREYIEKQIQKGFNRIAFVDDSPKNVEASRELHKKYPNVSLLVHHVKDKHETPNTDSPEDVPAPIAAGGEVETKRQNIQQLLRTKIKNPETGLDILVATAIRDKTHPAYRTAMSMVQSYAKKHNIQLHSNR